MDDLSAATLSHLLGLSKGYMQSRIFLTALELDLFGVIGRAHVTAEEVASAAGADARAVEVLLNALAAMGLVERADDQFALPAPIRDLLSADGRRDVRPGLTYATHLWEAWSNLTEIVRTGKPFRWGEGDAFAAETAQAMRLHAEGIASRLAASLDCAGVGRMLDLGGGVGVHTIALLRRYPDLKAVLFERNAPALAAAAEDIARAGLKDRVTLREGDFFTDDLGEGYGLVLLASVVCTFGEGENRRLTAKAAEALAPGGRLVVCDSLLDASMTRPPSSALFGVHMLVTTSHGRAYTADEVSAWLEREGLTDLRRLPLGHARLVIGRRRDPDVSHRGG